MHIEESQLESFIADSGLVSKNDLAAAKIAAEESNQGVGTVLVNKGLLTEDDLRRSQAYLLGIPFVDLKNQKLDFDTLSLIPEPIARRHNIIAFKKTADALEVAMLDPQDLGAIDFIKEKLSLKVLPRLTDAESLKQALIHYQKRLKAEYGDSIQHGPTLDLILKHALLQRASHVHIQTEVENTLVRYRIGGVMRDAMVLPKNLSSKVADSLRELAGQKEAKSVVQEGRFKIDAGGESVSASFTIMPLANGEKIALRLSREPASGYSLESLGFEGDALEDLHQALFADKGLILAAGERASGKTTLLYTMLDLLNDPALSLATIEDPVEHQLPLVGQTQVKVELGLTFASGLRTLLRQDPDIVMVGEIKDASTAQLAVSAAKRGVLVMAGVSASTAEEAVKRLLEFNVTPADLAYALKAVAYRKIDRKGEEIISIKNEVLSRERIDKLLNRESN